MNVRSILAIVDPGAHEHIGVAKAAALARAFQAQLHLFICDTQLSREMRMIAGLGTHPENPLTINLQPMLEDLAGPLRQSGLQVTTDTAFADRLHEGLLDRITAVKPDLVVKDTHHHSLARRTIVTNTDWHLIRECPAPLLLTKNVAWAARPTLLAAIDPEHVNDKAAALDQEILSWSSRVRDALHGQLHAVHAFIPLAIATTAATGAPLAGTLATPELIRDEETQKRQRISQLATRDGLAAADIHVSLGTAGDVLPRVAQEVNADIIVMGAIARSPIKRLFIGNTAERVLEHLPCDALIVKTPQTAQS
jgi:universal stress protein E